MSDTDSPDAGSGNDTALSIDAGAAAIEGLLSRVPEFADQADEDSATNEESQTEDQNEHQPAAASADVDDDLPLELDEETPDEGTDAPAEPEYKAGQFAARDAKVKLDDGTTISVSDLIAGNMFQRKFTEKTMALAEERKAFEAERGQFADAIKQIEQQRNVILTLAPVLLPQEPQPPSDPEDIVAYVEYTRQKEQYDLKMRQLHFLMQQQQSEQGKLTEQQKQEQEQQAQEYKQRYMSALEAERDMMFKAIPRLKDEKEREKFFEEAAQVGQHYGLSPDEIKGIADHRYVRVLDALMKYHRALAKLGNGKQKPAPGAAPAQTQQPARIQPRQRMAPQTAQAQAQNTALDRLRKTGSREDAAAALLKFV